MKLETTYLGLHLRNPLVASAGPLSQSVEQMQALADAGVGAIVMYSLFEEELRNQAEADELLIDLSSGGFAEALSYFPMYDEEQTPESLATGYLRLVEQAAQTVSVPVLASLNGSSPGSWVRFAERLQDAGAAGIECNVYFVPGDVDVTGEQVENRHVEIAQAVAEAVSIPVAVKLSPQLSSVGHLAMRLAGTGIKGLTMFSRSFQPDVDIDALRVEPGVTLSRPDDAVLPRTWIAALRNHLPNTSLAATSGVESAADVVKYLLAGADVVMSTSALVRHGVGHVAELLAGVEEWAKIKGFESVDDFRGMLAVPTDAEPNAYQRAGYYTALDAAKTKYGSPTA